MSPAVTVAAPFLFDLQRLLATSRELLTANQHLKTSTFQRLRLCTVSDQIDEGPQRRRRSHHDSVVAEFDELAQHQLS